MWPVLRCLETPNPACSHGDCLPSEVGHPFDCLMRCFNQSWDLVLHVAWGIHHPKNINLYRLGVGPSQWHSTQSDVKSPVIWHQVTWHPNSAATCAPCISYSGSSFITEYKSNQDQITGPGTRAWTSSFSVIKDSGVTAVTVVCVRPTHECCCWRGSWYIAWVKLQRSSKLDTAFTTWQKVDVWQLPAIISSS